MGDEIERKFLPRELPNLKQCKRDEILQGYLTISENSSVRVRNKGDKYFLGFKSGRGLKRQELEPELSRAQFDELWPGTDGRRVVKTRHYVPEGPHTAEVNVYHGRLEGLVLFEVEFRSEEDGEKFSPPSWFGEEVTNNPKFLDMNLALYGTDRVAGLPKFQYGLDEGLVRLIQAVEERLPLQKRVVVNVAGGTSSGKTSAVASKLKERFGGQAILISMDDYYRGNAFMQALRDQGREINWDMPDALDLELLAEHLQTLKSGRPVQKPIYSFKTGERAGAENVSPARVIVVEGLFALNSHVISDADIRAYVDISTHGMLLRRLLRDVHRTNQNPSDILKYFASTVLPMHEQYVRSTKVNSDLVICNEYIPAVEAHRSGTYEIQVKFRACPHAEDLRQHGAESLGATVQADRYFVPNNGDFKDESIRVRNESGRLLLSYKGPKVSSDVRKRPKFEFEIDVETEQHFNSIYKVKAFVDKKRALYQLDDVVFSVDDVHRSDNGSRSHLGGFVEIRSKDEASAKNLASRLGLDWANRITESYLEII